MEEKMPYESFTGFGNDCEKDAKRKIDFYRDSSIYWQDKYMELRKNLEVLTKEIDKDDETKRNSRTTFISKRDRRT